MPVEIISAGHFMDRKDYFREQRSWEWNEALGYKAKFVQGKVLCGSKDSIGVTYKKELVGCDQCKELLEKEVV